MNIEEDLTSLKEVVAIRKERCHGFIDSDSCLVSTKRLENLLTAYEKEKELLELASNMLDNIDYDQIPIAIGELKSELEKEKEKNKKAIDFINERKKTVNKDMTEGTRLQVGTFMWQVDELLEILKEE